MALCETNYDFNTIVKSDTIDGWCRTKRTIKLTVNLNFLATYVGSACSRCLFFTVRLPCPPPFGHRSPCAFGQGCIHHSQGKSLDVYQRSRGSWMHSPLCSDSSVWQTTWHTVGLIVILIWVKERRLSSVFREWVYFLAKWRQIEKNFWLRGRLNMKKRNTGLTFKLAAYSYVPASPTAPT